MTLRFLALVSLAAVVSFGRRASAQTLNSELFAEGFSTPVGLEPIPGDPTRMIVVERTGFLKLILNGAVQPTPYLDIRHVVTSTFERGLLGLAFHPDYASNGRFFVCYTDLSSDTRIVEYGVNPANPNRALPTAVQQIDFMDQPAPGHNGGCLCFGPDGKLYAAMGDGGQFHDPNNRAQDLSQPLGKILRYDVDLPPPFIPADNPLVGQSGANARIYHSGLRNPWRISFDSLTGDLYIADVGESELEEVNVVPAGQSNLNFGWRCMEADECTGWAGCTCNSPSLTLPDHTYDHSNGCAIIGGHTYRGQAIPWLQGAYLFGDWCSGKIWSGQWDGVSAFTRVVEQQDSLQPVGDTITQIHAFGEDLAGELYIVERDGQIWRIVEDNGWRTYCDDTVADNSTGVPAAIGASGSASVSANGFTIDCDALPLNTFGLFFRGPDMVRLPVGSGVLCVTRSATVPTVPLMPVLNSGAFGRVQTDLDLSDPVHATGPAAIAPGTTFRFQYWYRDASPSGGVTFNYSDALSVLFYP